MSEEGTSLISNDIEWTMRSTMYGLEATISQTNGEPQKIRPMYGLIVGLNEEDQIAVSSFFPAESPVRATIPVIIQTLNNWVTILQRYNLTIPHEGSHDERGGEVDDE